jgi:hypothetical protein
MCRKLQDAVQYCCLLVFNHISETLLVINVWLKLTAVMENLSVGNIIPTYNNVNKWLPFIFLMFMGPCIVIIFQYINPNKMHKSQSLFYLTTALHVSGVTITHSQKHKTTVTTASGNRYTVLLSATIVEFQLFHNSSRQQYGVTVTRCCSYSCFVLLRMGNSDARNM